MAVGKRQLFFYGFYFRFINFRKIPVKLIYAFFARKIQYVYFIARRVDFFAGIELKIQIQAVKGAYGVQGRLINFMIRNRQEIKPCFPVIDGYHFRRFYAVGAKGMGVHVTLKGQQSV